MWVEEKLDLSCFQISYLTSSIIIYILIGLGAFRKVFGDVDSPRVTTPNSLINEQLIALLINKCFHFS